MSISIIQPGMFTTVQDEGRFGFQHLGFSSVGPIIVYSRLGPLLPIKDLPNK